MTSLQERQAQAQKIADTRGIPIMIMNFNRYSPYYVMREYEDGDEKRPEFVSVHKPQKDTLAVGDTP